MRQITRDAINAFYGNYNFTCSNTSVRVMENVETGKISTKMYLHGNLIAKKVKGVTSITNAGRSSNVTKERLNGLRGVSICQKNFVWFLNGKEWDGSWVVVE